MARLHVMSKHNRCFAKRNGTCPFLCLRQCHSLLHLCLVTGQVKRFNALWCHLCRSISIWGTHAHVLQWSFECPTLSPMVRLHVSLFAVCIFRGTYWAQKFGEASVLRPPIFHYQTLTVFNDVQTCFFVVFCNLFIFLGSILSSSKKTRFLEFAPSLY